MNTVKIHTAQIDKYIEVLGLDAREQLCRMQYGQLGHPHPYLRVREVIEALKSCKPRTAEDRFALLERGYTFYWFSAEGDCTGKVHKYCSVSSPSGQKLTDISHGFESLEEALDFVLDMEEHEGALER
tara:strand:- start:357 stop:740 length:384 start_codon:yes stop_codon:yes gene_type:complete